MLARSFIQLTSSVSSVGQVFQLRAASSGSANGQVALQAAVAEMNVAAGIGGDVGLVSDHDHGHAGLAVQPLKDRHDLDAGAGIQRSGRLIGQDDARMGDDGAGDRDALLLSTGQAGWGSVRNAR